MYNENKKLTFYYSQEAGGLLIFVINLTTKRLGIRAATNFKDKKLPDKLKPQFAIEWVDDCAKTITEEWEIPFPESWSALMGSLRKLMKP
tara:strand:- start:6439 stop:6708 length:270 start_codon:yes stop_codon:yes gene_type:complete